ncbi:hypothetical protein PR048_018482 [Dryococelus australis]|uniref:Uncharacterized protein n=1 Tax=Dryococelus australis TaxID=614101 RepID=A0ABQ9HCL3_9NEOP|nr:hypothetical protein PR048_018482 [Dryococelus australis]
MFIEEIGGKRFNSVTSPTREAPKHLSGYCRHQRPEKFASSMTCRLDSAVVCTNMPISAAHWSSAVTVEGDDCASVLQEASNTVEWAPGISLPFQDPVQYEMNPFEHGTQYSRGCVFITRLSAIANNIISRKAPTVFGDGSYLTHQPQHDTVAIKGRNKWPRRRNTANCGGTGALKNSRLDPRIQQTQLELYLNSPAVGEHEADGKGRSSRVSCSSRRRHFPTTYPQTIPSSAERRRPLHKRSRSRGGDLRLGMPGTCSHKFSTLLPNQTVDNIKYSDDRDGKTTRKTKFTNVLQKCVCRVRRAGGPWYNVEAQVECAKGLHHRFKVTSRVRDSVRNTRECKRGLATEPDAVLGQLLLKQQLELYPRYLDELRLAFLVLVEVLAELLGAARRRRGRRAAAGARRRRAPLARRRPRRPGARAVALALFVHCRRLLQREVHRRRALLPQRPHRVQQAAAVRRIEHADGVQVVVAVVDERLRVLAQVQRAQPFHHDVAVATHCRLPQKKKKNCQAFISSRPTTDDEPSQPRTVSPRRLFEKTEHTPSRAHVPLKPEGFTRAARCDRSAPSLSARVVPTVRADNNHRPPRQRLISAKVYGAMKAIIVPRIPVACHIYVTDPLTNGIVRHDSHLRKSGDPAGDWTRFALVEGEQANRSSTMSPRGRGVEACRLISEGKSSKITGTESKSRTLVKVTWIQHGRRPTEMTEHGRRLCQIPLCPNADNYRPTTAVNCKCSKRSPSAARHRMKSRRPERQRVATVSMVVNLQAVTAASLPSYVIGFVAANLVVSSTVPTHKHKTAFNLEIWEDSQRFLIVPMVTWQRTARLEK